MRKNIAFFSDIYHGILPFRSHLMLATICFNIVPNVLHDIMGGLYCFEENMIQTQLIILNRPDHLIMFDLCRSEKDLFVATSRREIEREIEGEGGREGERSKDDGDSGSGREGGEGGGEGRRHGKRD